VEKLVTVEVSYEFRSGLCSPSRHLVLASNANHHSLKYYYLLNPSAPKNRCPTSIFVTAASQAFRGSGEIEDGSITIEDIIVVIASLVDQVSETSSPPLTSRASF
jgi:hypothetical protein